MKRFIILFSALMIAFSFSSCGKNENTDTSSIPSQTSQPTLSESQTETATRKAESTSYDIPTDEKPTERETKKSALEELETSEVVTYYCDDPNNKYITSVSKKYGVDKNCLIALIRTNAVNNGATVLEFSGETNSDGVLLTTEENLRAVYEVLDKDGSIKKATGKMSGNDGYNYVESLATFKLTKEFIIPNLDEMKRERPYKGQ